MLDLHDSFKSSFMIEKHENIYNFNNTIPMYLEIDCVYKILSECSIFDARNFQLTCKAFNYYAKKWYRHYETQRIQFIIAGAKNIDNEKISKLVNSIEHLMERYKDNLIIGFTTSGHLLTQILQIGLSNFTKLHVCYTKNIDFTLKKIYGHSIRQDYTNSSIGFSEKFALDAICLPNFVHKENVGFLNNILETHHNYIDVLKLIHLYTTKEFSNIANAVTLHEAYENAKLYLDLNRFSEFNDNYLKSLNTIELQYDQLNSANKHIRSLEVKNSLERDESTINTVIDTFLKKNFISLIKFFNQYSLQSYISTSMIKDIIDPLVNSVKILKRIDETKIKLSINLNDHNKNTQLKIEQLLNLLASRINILVNFEKNTPLIEFYYSIIVNKIKNCKTGDEAYDASILITNSVSNINLRIHLLEKTKEIFAESFSTSKYKTYFDAELKEVISLRNQALCQMESNFRSHHKSKDLLLIDNQDQLIEHQNLLEINKALSPQCISAIKYLTTILKAQQSGKLYSKMMSSDENHDGFNESMIELFNEFPGFLSRYVFTDKEFAAYVYSSILWLFNRNETIPEKNIVKSKEIILTIDKEILFGVINNVNMQRLWASFESVGREFQEHARKNLLGKEFLSDYKIKIAQKLLNELISTGQFIYYFENIIDSPYKNFHKELLNLFEKFPNSLSRYYLDEDSQKSFYYFIFKLFDSELYPNKLHVKKLIFDQIESEYLRNYFNKILGDS